MDLLSRHKDKGKYQEKNDENHSDWLQQELNKVKFKKKIIFLHIITNLYLSYTNAYFRSLLFLFFIFLFFYLKIITYIY